MATRLPTTVTVGSVATAVGGRMAGRQQLRPDRDGASGQEAEGQDGGEEVVGHDGLPVNWRIGDALDVNVGSAACAFPAACDEARFWRDEPLRTATKDTLGRRRRACRSPVQARRAPVGASRRTAWRGGRVRLPGLVEQRRLEHRGALRAVVDRPEHQRARRHRLGEQEALQLVAAHLHQHLLLALVLDALGDDLEAERVGELDDRVDDGARVGAVLEVLDEAAVDLELLGRAASADRLRLE